MGGRIRQILAQFKDCHDDGRGVADDPYGDPHLDEIPEKHPGIHIVEIVAVGDHGDKFIAQDRRDDHSCDGDHDSLGQALDHGEDPTVPFLWSLAYLCGDVPSLCVDV